MEINRLPYLTQNWLGIQTYCMNVYSKDNYEVIVEVICGAEGRDQLKCISGSSKVFCAKKDCKIKKTIRNPFKWLSILT